MIVLLLIAGCNGDDETPPTATLPSISPEEIIAQSSPMLDTLSSFHFDLSQEGGGTPIAMDLEMTGAEGDIAPPDKLSMSITATWGSMYVETGLVTVGQITYMQNPINKKWELLSDDFKAVTLFSPETGVKAVMDSATDLVLLGIQSEGGVPNYHLKGLIRSEVLDAIAVGHSAEGLPVDVEMWIGVDDLLLRKVVFDGRICDDENEGIVRTLVLSDFNEPVNIELPE